MNTATDIPLPDRINSGLQRAIRRLAVFPVWWSLGLVIILLFSQFWFDVRGRTIRSIDLVLIIMVISWLRPLLTTGRIRYVKSRLNPPMLAWVSVILLGMVVAQFRPLSDLSRQDAVVNAIRLALSVSLFFIVSQSTKHIEHKSKTVFITVISFSLITTFVSLLQIGYWGRWLPIDLPDILTTFKSGANQAQGREIFGLFVGNTGTHVWSAMLAMQALTVLVASITTHQRLYRYGGLLYFLLLTMILVRTSVRNSTLGLGVAVFLLMMLLAWKSRFPFNRLAVPVITIFGAGILIVALLSFDSDQYFIQRVVQAIPRLGSEGVFIDRASNIYGRLDYMRVALLIFSQYPFLGGGFYSYAWLSNSLGGLVNISHAHNSYIQALAELGLNGFLVFCWLLWQVGRLLVVSSRGIAFRQVDERRIWYLSFVTLVFLLFTALFANPFWEPNEVGFFVILVAVLEQYSRERS
jgi:O-antigen ligase